MMRALLAALFLCWASVSNAQEAADKFRFGPGPHMLSSTIQHVERSSVIGGRPSVCPPRRWCGCWASIQKFGKSVRHLWVARAWAKEGSPASPDTANVVVWRNHVGFVKARRGNQILVHSGNDGNAVRERWRSTRGVIAWRQV
jgi:hypothetical protein